MISNIFLSFITGIVTHVCMCAETELDLKKHIVPDYTQLSYEQRKEYAPNEIGKKLFDIMTAKKTNLAVALDTESLESVIKIAQLIGSYICILKIHADILKDFFSENQSTRTSFDSEKFVLKKIPLIYELKKIANDLNFLIMEDRKFADIASVVQQQYTGGSFQIAHWADLVTAHSLSGGGMIEAMQEALKKENIKEPRGVIMLPQMSTKENLLTPEYTLRTIMQIIQLKEKGINLPTGLITRSKIAFKNKQLDYGMLRMTPGIGLFEHTNKDQQYITPQKAFENLGTDIAIVGRAIYNSQNPIETAQELQQKCWNEYSQRIYKE